MSPAESEAMSRLVDALARFRACVDRVLENKDPNSASVSWWASGREPLSERFAGFTLNRTEALAVHAALKVLLGAQS